MSAATKAKRQSKAKAAPAKAVPAPAKPKRKKSEPTAEAIATAAAVQRSEAISTAMLELSEARLEARAKRGGTPAKHLIFNEWLKALLANKPFDVDAIAKKYEGEIKASTIKSWRNGFRNGSLPANGRDKAKQIAAAIKKGATA